MFREAGGVILGLSDEDYPPIIWYECSRCGEIYPEPGHHDCPADLDY